MSSHEYISLLRALCSRATVGRAINTTPSQKGLGMKYIPGTQPPSSVRIYDTYVTKPSILSTAVVGIDTTGKTHIHT